MALVHVHSIAHLAIILTSLIILGHGGTRVSLLDLDEQSADYSLHYIWANILLHHLDVVQWMQ